MTEVIVWSGWVGGLAIGIYGLFPLVISGKLLGASTSYGSVCSLASSKPYFRSGPFEERNSWRLWFFVGIPLGGLVAALTSPEPIVASLSMGAMYDSVLPVAPAAKGLVLLIGGIMIGLGSRLAGGCPSGHSIAGLSLLSGPSLVASAGFFAGGIIMVQLLFRVLG